MALLNFDLYLVEYWHEGKGADWRWTLDHTADSLDDARRVAQRLAAEGKKTRVTQVLEMLDAVKEGR